jgi:hypothetical protein
VSTTGITNFGISDTLSSGINPRAILNPSFAKAEAVLLANSETRSEHMSLNDAANAARWHPKGPSAFELLSYKDPDGVQRKLVTCK